MISSFHSYHCKFKKFTLIVCYIYYVFIKLNRVKFLSRSFFEKKKKLFVVKNNGTNFLKKKKFFISFKVKRDTELDFEISLFLNENNFFV